jgi:hypothetical protein
MEDDGIPIKKLIEEALNECQDLDLLDLVYKLLTSNQS